MKIKNLNNITNFNLLLFFVLNAFIGVLFLLYYYKIGYLFYCFSFICLLLFFTRAFYDFENRKFIKPKLKVLIFIDMVLFISNLNGANEPLIIIALTLFFIIIFCILRNIFTFLKTRMKVDN